MLITAARPNHAVDRVAYGTAVSNDSIAAIHGILLQPLGIIAVCSEKSSKPAGSFRV
jgi:hypothetical protein